MLQILLVEDNPADARLLTEELSELPDNPLAITHVQTLGDAFIALDSGRYDAVLLDLHLPDSDGARTISRVHGHSPKLPIVVLTGIEDERAESEAVRLGADDFLVKGETPAKMFLRSIRYAIDRKRLSGLREQYLRNMSILVRLSTDVLAAETLGELLEVIAAGARQLTSASCCMALITDSQKVEHAVSYTDEYSGVSALKIENLSSFLLDRVEVGKTLRLSTEQLHESPVWLDCTRGFLPQRGILGKSLFDSTMKVIGAVVVCDPREDFFSSEEEFALGQLATIASLALQHLEARSQAQSRARELEIQKQQLENALDELESFTYSVSHDLRAPLRSISGFSTMVAEECGMKISEDAVGYLSRIEQASQKMSDLIDDLLSLSRVTRQDLAVSKVSLSDLAETIVADLVEREPTRQVEISIQKGVVAEADSGLIRVALANIFENAWKFTSHVVSPRIEFGMEIQGDEKVYYIRDNGVGFDIRFVQKIFMPFQRLHKDADFPGTGIGLAIVERVIKRHGGKLWAQSSPNQGTTIFFTIGL